MATREPGGQSQSGRSRRDEEIDEAPAPDASAEVAERHEKLSEDVDDLLDEIDSVLGQFDALLPSRARLCDLRRTRPATCGPRSRVR